MSIWINGLFLKKIWSYFIEQIKKVLAGEHIEKILDVLIKKDIVIKMHKYLMNLRSFLTSNYTTSKSVTDWNNLNASIKNRVLICLFND